MWVWQVSNITWVVFGHPPHIIPFIALEQELRILEGWCQCYIVCLFVLFWCQCYFVCLFVLFWCQCYIVCFVLFWCQCYIVRMFVLFCFDVNVILFVCWFCCRKLPMVGQWVRRTSCQLVAQLTFSFYPRPTLETAQLFSNLILFLKIGSQLPFSLYQPTLEKTHTPGSKIGLTFFKVP